MMCTGGGARRHTGDVSLIDVRRTLRGTKDRGQDPIERLLTYRFRESLKHKDDGQKNL